MFLLQQIHHFCHCKSIFQDNRYDESDVLSCSKEYKSVNYIRNAVLSVVFTVFEFEVERTAYHLVVLKTFCILN